MLKMRWRPAACLSRSKPIATLRRLRRTERVALNQYRAGVIDQTTLLVAQSTARDARISALQVSSQRLTTAVSLIEALGGGWQST